MSRIVPLPAFVVNCRIRRNGPRRQRRNPKWYLEDAWKKSWTR